MRQLFFAAIAILLSHGLSLADEPSVSYIFPAGGQRGTRVNFRVGGHYLHDSCSFEMLGADVVAANRIEKSPHTTWFEGPVIPLPASQRKEDYPVDYLGNVEISENATVGFRRWRVSTSQGATDSKLFVVGDLPEIIEREIDGRPIPTEVDTPVTINGRIFPREDIDIWSFTCKAGRGYTCEVTAARLGSPLDSKLQVTGADGRPIAENTDHFGTDSMVRFVAPRDGTYHVRIHDINFAGLQDYVYRLTITDQPVVDHIFPLGGRRGQRTFFQMFGQALPAESLYIDLPITDAPTHQHVLRDGQHVSRPFTIELSDLPEFVESREHQGLMLPAVLNGCIEQPGEIDRWRFHATQGDAWSFDLRAARLGSKLDSVIRILDADGKQLAESDDMGSAITDSFLKFVPPADGLYTVEVQDRFSSRGGRGFSYRLQIDAPQPPDFELTIPVDALTIPRGGEAKLKVAVTRRGGFQGEIKLDFENLPDGVSVPDGAVRIPAKKANATIVLTAGNKAAIAASQGRLTGSGNIDGQVVSRLAQKPGISPLDQPLDHLMVAIAMPTPFKVIGVFETKYAARGSTYMRHYTIDRGGFTGPITVRMADRQVRHLQGVTGPRIVVPAGESEFDYPIKLPPWMEVGRTSRTCVMAVGVVEENNQRHKVSYTSHAQNDQIIVLVDPGQLSVDCERGSLLAVPGKTLEVPVRIGRGRDLRYAVRVELVVPPHIKGISAMPLSLHEFQDEGRLQVKFADGQLGPFNMPVIIRATLLRDGLPYTAESQLEIVAPRGDHD